MLTERKSCKEYAESHNRKGFIDMFENARIKLIGRT